MVAKSKSVGTGTDNTFPQSLSKVCMELHIPEAATLRDKYGISTFQELQSTQTEWGSGGLSDLKDSSQLRLSAVVEYIVDAKREHLGTTNCDPLKDFSINTFLDHFRQSKKRYDNFKRALVHGGGEDNTLQSLTESDQEKFAKLACELTMRKYLSKELLKKPWRQNVLYECAAAAVNITCDNQCIVFYGPTQSGKSALKATASSLCLELGLFVVVITKGVKESLELSQRKLKAFLAECPKGNLSERIVSTSNFIKETWNRDLVEVAKLLVKGGLLVAADTFTQVGRVIQAIEMLRQEEGYDRKFVVILDEVDTMFRTEEGCQAFEEQFQKLMALKPLFTIATTATPITACRILDEEGTFTTKLVEIETDPDYLGLEDMELFRDRDGNDLFLPKQGLQVSEGIEFNHAIIPKTNEDVMKLYDDAAIHRPKNGAKGILLLDITTPWVTVPNKNVKVKATLIQSYYLEKGRSIAVFVSVGEGILLKLPRDDDWTKYDQTVDISHVVSLVDRLNNGMKIPVFGFGFSKFFRGVSCRSHRRVPTHLIHGIGDGHSIDNMIQAMGRATFKGKDILARNMGPGYKVQLLTSQADYETMRKHQLTIRDVCQSHQEGSTFQEALRSATDTFGDYTDLSKKRAGQRKEAPSGERAPKKTRASETGTQDIDENVGTVDGSAWPQDIDEMNVDTIDGSASSHPSSPSSSSSSGKSQDDAMPAVKQSLTT